MRFVSLLISMQMVLTSFSTAWAGPAAERLVQLLKHVCVVPATPDGMVEAGDALASAEGWKLLGSGPTPLPIMHNEGGPKISNSSVWDVEEPAPSRVMLAVSVVRPSIPAVKHSVCWILPKVDIPKDELTKAVEEQFGSMLTRDMSGRFRDGVYWYFTQEKAVGNCGKQLVILNQSELRDWGSRMLMFTDFAYPNDGHWVGARSGTFCRS